MLMGLRPEIMMETNLKPRSIQTGATWQSPPVLLMAAANDHHEILELINRTHAALQTMVRSLHNLHCLGVLPIGDVQVTACFYEQCPELICTIGEQALQQLLQTEPF